MDGCDEGTPLPTLGGIWGQDKCRHFSNLTEATLELVKGKGILYA